MKSTKRIFNEGYALGWCSCLLGLVISLIEGKEGTWWLYFASFITLIILMILARIFKNYKIVKK